MAQLDAPIRTERLTLRRFDPSDLESLCELYGDAAVTRFLYWDVRDRDETLEVLHKKLAAPVGIEHDNVLPVAVERNDDGRLVGDFMLHWTDDEHRQGEMGGLLLAVDHGRGLATEVYRQLLVIGFDTYHLHRVVGRCDARNRASIRSLEKAGLHQEAHLVENEFVKGEWTDEVVMAIRRRELSAGRDAPPGRR